MALPALLTPEQVSEALSLHIKTIYRYIEDGEFPHVKCIKRSYRIPESDVLAFLERHPLQDINKRRMISRGF